VRPDVVLMDARMPEVDGLAATRTLLAAGSPHRLRIVMLTTFDVDEYVYEALRAGVSGFRLKDATPEALVEAVRVAAAGDALLAPSITRRMIERFAARRRASRRDAQRLAGRAAARRPRSGRRPAARIGGGCPSGPGLRSPGRGS
jgi:DNA-binding NarL/FixJ family response regulator